MALLHHNNLCYGQDVSQSGGDLLRSGHQPIRRVESYQCQESTDNRAQHLVITEEVLGDNWNDRVGMSTTLEYKYVHRIAHSQSHEENFPVSNRNTCQPTTGDRSALHTLLCEDPSPSGSTTWPLPSNRSQEVVESSDPSPRFCGFYYSTLDSLLT
jgi:hypothetical protein